MLKKNEKSSAFRWYSAAGIVIIVLGICGCDRGATEQIQAAQKFADATVRNNTAARDSMVATRLFKRHFENEFVRSDFINWMGTIYNMHASKFSGSARADVDRDLKADLESGGLLYPEEIEETGMVRVRSPIEGEPSAYFWMVKQKGRHWAVAMVTKGEMTVNFRQ